MKREEDVERLPISLIWLENRRTFSFNTNINTNTNTNTNVNVNTSTNPVITKAFHLNFIPSGRLSFLLISSDGSIEIFIENPTEFDIIKLKTFEPTVLMGSFAYQRPNGTVLIFLRTNSHWTISQISDNFELELKQKQELESDNILNSNFIWSESKESLIRLLGKANQLTITSYPTSTTYKPITVIVDLPFDIEKEEILHSSRASNYLFLQSNSKILILNLNGEIVKQLSLEPDNSSDIINDNTIDNNVYDSYGPLLISPNGLVVAKISEEFDDFPIIQYSPIGEITLKSKKLLN